MAVAFRGYEPSRSSTVAVRALPPQLAFDAQSAGRFQREARDAASLSHPSIVGLQDVVEEHGLDCNVMEYLRAEPPGRGFCPLPVWLPSSSRLRGRSTMRTGVALSTMMMSCLQVSPSATVTGSR